MLGSYVPHSESIPPLWRREPERARMPTDPRHAGSSPLAPEAHHHHSQSLRVLTRSRVLTTALLAVANRQTTDASRSANSCDTIARCALQRANPTPIYNKIALNQRPVLSDSCKCERERTESQIGVDKHRCRGNALPKRRVRTTSCTVQAHLINSINHGTLL